MGHLLRQLLERQAVHRARPAGVEVRLAQWPLAEDQKDVVAVVPGSQEAAHWEPGPRRQAQPPWLRG